MLLENNLLGPTVDNGREGDPGYIFKKLDGMSDFIVSE